MRLPPKTKQKMTFESDPDACREVGRLIYEAATDEAALNRFQKNAVEQLINAGIAEDAFVGKSVTVVEDTGATIHIIIPDKVRDAKQVTDRYLQELGFVTIMGCR